MRRVQRGGGQGVTDVYLRLLKGKYNIYVILFQHGKVRTPLLMLEEYEFEGLIKEYKKQKGEMKEK